MGDEPMFDLTKKKKKKKGTFTMDGDVDIPKESSNSTTDIGDTEEVNVEQNTEEISLDDDFSNLTKKKKKKKKPFSLTEMEESLPSSEPASETTPQPDSDTETPTPEGGNMAEDGFDSSLPMKKKKKKKVILIEPGEEDVTDGGKGVGGSAMEGKTWQQDSGVEYTYDELLNRVFDIMRERNPEMVAGEKRRFIMKPPQVLRVGTKKTSFSNFADICKMLHRQPKHLLAFLLAELGTSGSIDGNNQLIIKGRFQQKQIENVLRRYIKEYVTCHTCRSPDTILQKDTRLYFLQCETCGSRCSVASIKSGFQAVTGKRAAIRARTK
ncbi:Eukaryotic translation initiation factor 2 subunit 2 [Lamellibrachia satsuma]|nr:Eukaryotic translation initiation factor 2 subunit 2 [Lamellibrachia satsuma]